MYHPESSGKIRHLKNIETLLEALYPVKLPVHDRLIHLHRHEDAAETEPSETTIFRSCAFAVSYLREGEAHYQIGLSSYHIKPGALYFMGPRHLRHYRKLKPWKGYLLLFMEEFANSRGNYQLPREYPFFELDADVLLPLTPEQAAPFEQQFETMLALYRSDRPEKLGLLYHHLHLLLIEARSRYLQRHSFPTPERPTRLVKEFERRVEEHFYQLAKNPPNRKLTIRDLADQLHVSPTYLSEVLKKETGRTASYVIQIRTVLEAKSLLRNTELTVSEIAFLLGFDDNAYFARLFRKHAGLAPSAFRRRS